MPLSGTPAVGRESDTTIAQRPRCMTDDCLLAAYEGWRFRLIIDDRRSTCGLGTGGGSCGEVGLQAGINLTISQLSSRTTTSPTWLS